MCEYQRFVVNKNFLRVADAMNERTLSVVAMGMQNFVFDVSTSISHLADANITSSSVRDVIYLEVTRQLNGRIDMAERAQKNESEFKSALLQGKPIFNYKVSD